MAGDHDHSGGSCEFEDIHDYDQGLSIGAVFIVLAASLLGTVLPIISKRYYKAKQPNNPNVHQSSPSGWPFAILVGKHAGTGVLLSLAFIHLLVPAFAQLGSECLPESWHEFPYAALFAMLAAVMMHLIETAVLEYTVYNMPGYDNQHPHDGPSGGPAIEMVECDDMGKHTNGTNGSIDDTIKDPASVTKTLATGSDGSVVLAIDRQVHHGHSHGLLLSSKAERTIGAYLLEFGLTSHSIIVGITLGVAPGHDQVSLIPALTFHQFFEGFALGARLAELEFGGWNEAVLTLIYSLSAPLGIAIGIGIAHSYHSGSVTALLVQGIFDSVSAGIILYVAFVNMLAAEFPADFKSCGRNRVKKAMLLGGLYLGVAVMAIIGMWL